MDGECELHLFSLAVHRPHSCLLSRSSSERHPQCINIYPGDVRPCSATAKPLSRKVNFTSSPSPTPSIFHISTIHFMQFISRLVVDCLTTCSNSPGCWMVRLDGGVGGWGLGRLQQWELTYEIFMVEMGVWVVAGKMRKIQTSRYQHANKFSSLEAIRERRSVCSLKYAKIHLFVSSIPIIHTNEGHDSTLIQHIPI